MRLAFCSCSHLYTSHGVSTHGGAPRDLSDSRKSVTTMASHICFRNFVGVLPSGIAIDGKLELGTE
jgi:hypothetical protein